MLAGCGGASRETVTVVRTVTAASPLDGNADQSLYGHIVSLTPSGSVYLLQFRPFWWLTGVTANVAAAQDMQIACAPKACRPVPNDYYAVDGRRTFTFLVPADVRGRVLTPGRYLEGKEVGVAELARIVHGTSTVKLFEPLDSGVWIRVHGDTVRGFKQQFRP